MNRETAERCTILRGLVGSTVHGLNVNAGKITEHECLTRAGELERELADLEMTSALPEAPEEARVEEWMLDAYRRSWYE